MKIAIIGVGRLGGALALALAEKNYQICQLISRGGEKARDIAIAVKQRPTPQILSAGELEKISADIIFITVPDAEIQITAENLAAELKYQPVVFHTSGALSSEVLESVRKIGCLVGSLHPLVSVSDSLTGAKHFKDAFFCLEGDREAVAIGEKIIADLKGNSFSVETKFKSLYHAAAVTASGHLVALFSVAVEMLAACNLSGEQARKILFPLIKSTVENLSRQIPSQALTGTFARADVETLKRHLEILRVAVTPELLEVYLQLGRYSLHLAQEQAGSDAEKLAAMRKLLTDEH